MNRLSAEYDVKKAEFVLEALDGYILSVDNRAQTRQERAEFIVLAADVLSSAELHLEFAKSQLVLKYE